MGFHSKLNKKSDIVNEVISFMGCRLITGMIDWLCMLIFVNILNFNDMLIKIIANIIVIILNYIASKFIIFNNKEKQFNCKKLLSIIPIVIMTCIIGFFLDLNPFNKYGISSTDSSVFRNVAEVILNGGMPYSDIFDHKGPLLYILNTLGQLINFKNGIWIIELFSIFVVLFFTYKSFKLFCKTTNSYIGTFLISTILIQYLEGGNLTEEYAIPFISVSLYIFLDYLKNQNISKLRIIICGFSFASVCLIRINMIPVWIAFSLAVLFKLIKEKKYDMIWKFLLYFVIGISIITLPIIIWLYCKGALSDFISQYFLFNFTYTSDSKLYNKVETALFFLENNLVLIALAINFFMIFKEKDFIGIVNFIAFMLTILVIGMSGLTFLHYGMILMSCCIYPFAKLFSLIENNFSNNYSSISLIVYIIFIILIGNTWINEMIESLNNYTNNPAYYEDKTVANEIKKITSKNDYITVYGNKTIYYLLSNRKSASKYYYQFPIGNMDKKILNEYYDDLTKNNPKLIIVNNIDNRMRKYISENNYKVIKTYESGVIIYGR